MASYRAEKHRAIAAESNENGVREAIVSVVVAQYLSLWRSKATQQAVQSRIDFADSLRKLVEDALQQGTGTDADALRAGVELTVEQQNLVSTRAQTSTYGYGPAEVLELSINEVIVASEELRSHDEEQLDDRASLAEALQTRPNLQSALGLRKAAAFDHKSTKTEWLPEFHFNGFWAESGRAPSHGPSGGGSKGRVAEDYHPFHYRYGDERDSAANAHVTGATADLDRATTVYDRLATSELGFAEASVAARKAEMDEQRTQSLAQLSEISRR